MGNAAYKLQECVNCYRLVDDTLVIVNNNKLYKIKNMQVVTEIDKIIKIVKKESYISKKELNSENENQIGTYLLKQSILVEEDKKEEDDNKEIDEFFKSIDSKALIVGPQYLQKHALKQLKNYVDFRNYSEVEEKIKMLDNDQYIITLLDLDMMSYIRKINVKAKELNKGIINIIAMKEQEVIVGPYFNTENIGCIDCLVTRMTMCSSYVDIRVNTLSSIKDIEVCGLENFSFLKGLFYEMGQAIKDIVKNSNNKVPTIKSIERDLNSGKIIVDKHVLLPSPKCKRCETDFSRLSYKENELDIYGAISKKIGLVTEVKLNEIEENTPKIHVAISSSSDFSKINKNMCRIGNSGASTNIMSAEQSAIGESLERYASALVNFEEIIIDSYSSMKKENLNLCDPSLFELFSEEQYSHKSFPYKRFNEDTVVGWSKGYNYLTKEEIYIPAAFIYIPYIKGKNEELITPYISTGLAAGQTLEHAILNGIYEVVERDNFSLSWLTKLNPQGKIDLNILDDFEETYPSNLKYRAYDISLDIPLKTIFAIVEGNIGDRNILSVGAATRLTTKEATYKALVEATQGRNYVNDLVDYFSDLELKSDFNNIDTFQKHALFYTKFEQLREKVGFLLNDESFEFRDNVSNRDERFINEINDMDIKVKLDFVVKSIRELGYDVIVKEITPIDLKLINVHVVRVIIPGLHGLHGTHKFRYLGGSRLKDINKLYKREDFKVNEFPHPFP